MSRTSRGHSHKSKTHTNIFNLNEALTQNGRAMVEGPKRKHWSSHDLKNIKPLTVTQEDMFHEFFAGNNICASGSAGTGKTYCAIYLALADLLKHGSETKRIIIVRSAVPSREQGFLPGTVEEKAAIYELPYKDMFADLLGHSSSYQDLKDARVIEFNTTSYVRGLTWDDAIVIVDECQNMNFAELDSVVTRLGDNSRLILCGDGNHQIDLRREQTGFGAMLRVIDRMSGFSTITFTHHDIIRSAFVKAWIIARDELNL